MIFLELLHIGKKVLVWPYCSIVVASPICSSILEFILLVIFAAYIDFKL